MAEKNPNMQPEGQGADNSAQYEAQIAELKNQLNASQTELESLRTQIAEAKVEAAIVANKIPISQKEWALGYAKANLAGFEEFLKGAVVPQQKLNLPNDMFENKNKGGEIDIVKYALGEE